MNSVERQRRNLRIIFFGIILATLPFYCAGFLLFGAAPQPSRPTASPTGQVNPVATTAAPLPTRTNPGDGVTIPPTFTQLVFPSPTIGVIIPPTIFIPPVLPTATFFIPTALPTFTPLPTETPPPSNTPFPTDPPPTDTALPIPSNTPLPQPTVEVPPAITPGG